ncbi:glycine-rich domain-containing protein [Rhodonellum sp.]|uniref:glycine-rich domain-containing protein n=1 Tax=Rhodonellum sp. TaxID=2231180 RepID=UPI002726A0D5|nr:hypothetical protein [Rhodonellum sp.]MDO9552373.1 hypothetical protein [Rhodonellum sp.]
MNNLRITNSQFLKFARMFFGVMVVMLFSLRVFGQTETRTFNTSGTFIVPHGVTSVEVQMWGGGGGGGYHFNNNRSAAGGGGGGFLRAASFSVTSLGTINFTIGTGGVGGGETITSTAGGNSIFGSLSALGGGAGNSSTGGAGGGTIGGDAGSSFAGGGSPNASTSNNNGGTGGGAAGNFSGVGNPGGGTTTTTGGVGGIGINNAGNGGPGGNNGLSGIAGTSPGGGGGGIGGKSGTSLRGGNGGNGRIVVSWTCPAPALISGPQEQTFCIGGSVSPVLYEVGGALNVTVTGLPEGVSFNYNQGNVNIFGTPTEAGTFTYTIRPEGSCEGNSIQGTIRVTPNNTAGTITANTFCRNTPIPANVFQPTNGAIGIGDATGLPGGISVNFNNNQIEFTGTPTQTGIFNYSISLTGGCGTVNATGTITVNEVVSAVNESLAGQTSCPGTPFNPISVREGFGLTYQWFSNTTAAYTGGTAISGETAHDYTPSSVNVGTTYYYVEVSGACGNTVPSSISGAFVVNPGNSVTPASSPPPVCINSAIAPITHTTTSATGISNAGDNSGINGLPPGVSATWSGSQITISGIPTAYGVFNYSIPLIGGCGNVAATGTITVNAAPAIIEPLTLPAQGSCLNGTFAPLSVGLGTGLSYQWFGNTSESNTGGTAITGATSNTYLPPSNTVGQRYYYVRVTNACGTTVFSNPSGLQEVYTLPTPSFTDQPPTGICVNEDRVYTTQAGQSSYQWGLPGVAGTDFTIVSGGSASDNTITVRWLTPGNKSLSVNYTNPNNCTAVNSTSSNTINIRRNGFTPPTTIPRVCANEMMLPVSIGTSLATGIGIPTGLPAGVTPNWDSNIITLTGTPSESGTFNYTIPLTGGCGTVSATGTIIVTPLYELTSTTSVSPSFEGGPAIVTIRGTTSNLPNGTYTITYSLGLANTNPVPLTATVNVVNGRGTFTTVGINNPDLTSLEILTIRRNGDACTVDLKDRNITFFGTCAAVFDANGEFFVPAGITEITIKVWGGGGGGGGRVNNNNAGGGGGGYSMVSMPVNPGNVLNVVIGAGGVGQTNNPSQNGNPSYVTRNPTNPDPLTSSIVYAYGGNRAIGTTIGTGGEGTTNNGDPGVVGGANTGGDGGNGGGPTGGAGGPGGFGTGQNTNGQNGSAPGGGGGGAKGNSNGGNGGSGLVIISYSCPPIAPDGCFTVIDDGSRSGATIIEFTCDTDWIAPEGLVDFDLVVIAGGGGGGAGKAAGGGGAGGLVPGYVSTSAEFGMPDGTTFNIKVGEGGGGAANEMVRGQNGEPSSLTGNVDGNAVSFSALGGGTGGSFGSIDVANGTTGASGGGGGFFRPSNYEGTGGASNGANGNIGGKGIFADVGGPQGGAAVGGGGGGAAGLGQLGKAAGNGQGDGGGGGLGIAYDLFGTTVNYGGGGGGVGYNFNGTVKDNFINGGRAPNGSFLGGSGNVSGPGESALGIGSGGGAGTGGGGNGGKGRVFIVYANVRILPVEYIFIKAEYLHEDRLAEITWATAKEWENSHFEVERSFQNINNWEAVGKVDGMGYSDEPAYYNFEDKNLPLTGGTVYYRLKQVGFSGKMDYSKVLSVRIPALQFTEGVWRAYPNPTDGEQLRISLMDRNQYDDEPITFRIIHPMSQTVDKSVRNESEMNEILSQVAKRIPRGVFVVEIKWGQKIEHIKVLRK